MLNGSLDYGYNNYRWSLAGETALNRNGAIATIHTVSLRANDQLSLMMLHRYYDKRYTALHGHSFSENSSVQNEHGVYAGFSWQPSRAFLFQGYADYAHFSWARYLVSASSDAFDAMLTARYDIRQWTLYGRYRYHLRQRDDSQKMRIVNKPEHRMRLGADWQAMPHLSFRTQADGIICQFQGKCSRGVMLGEHASWRWRWLKTDASLGWFCTDDYDSRIYQYESSVLYDFSFPMYYGKGIRYALMLRADVGKRLTASAKIGVTNYFDRSVISSGLQQIDHSSMADLLVQLCYKL